MPESADGRERLMVAGNCEGSAERRRRSSGCAARGAQSRRMGLKGSAEQANGLEGE